MDLSELLKNEPIIIVEDDVDLAEVFKDMLSEFKVPVRIYNTPHEALQSMRRETPSLILSDIHMPGMDGLELAKQIREIFSLVPIVLISGNATKEIAIKALKVGINEILDKPVNTDHLLGVVNKFITVRASYLQREKEELEVIVDSFVDESIDLLSGIDEIIMRLESKDVDRLLVDNLFRRIHSIKGSVGSVPNSSLLAKLSHEFETSLDKVRKGTYYPDEVAVNTYLISVDAIRKLLECVKLRELPSEIIENDVKIIIDKLRHLNQQGGIKSEIKADGGEHVSTHMQNSAAGLVSVIDHSEMEDQGVTVNNEKLDALLKLSGEMTMIRNYFQILARDAESQAKPEILYRKSDEMLRGFNKITDSLQKQIMELRQVQLSFVFSKLPRVVRTTAQELEKKVQIEFLGGQIGIDKNIAKDLNAVFVHLIRNAIDHGIEPAQKRSMQSKKLEGRIKIEAIQQLGNIKIVFSDDGAGLDRKRIEAVAIRKNLISDTEIQKLSDQEVFEFIFHPGFSTADQVSKFSGRGVGMDVVKSILTNHHGRLQIDSTVGQGTHITMTIPMVKSVLVESTVMVSDNGLAIGIPQAEIASIAIAKDMRINTMASTRSMQYNNMTIPLLSFNEIVESKKLLAEDDVVKKSIVVIQYKNFYLGLLVDSVDGQFEAVITPFDKLVKSLPGFKGTTLLGSDGVAYIVSVQKLFRLLNVDGENREAVAV